MPALSQLPGSVHRAILFFGKPVCPRPQGHKSEPKHSWRIHDFSAVRGTSCSQMGHSQSPSHSFSGCGPHPVETQGSDLLVISCWWPSGTRNWERPQARPPITVAGSLGPTQGRVFRELLTSKMLNEACIFPRDLELLPLAVPSALEALPFVQHLPRNLLFFPLCFKWATMKNAHNGTLLHRRKTTEGEKGNRRGLTAPAQAARSGS